MTPLAAYMRWLPVYDVAERRTVWERRWRTSDLSPILSAGSWWNSATAF
jgi:hypothetical protein